MHRLKVDLVGWVLLILFFIVIFLAYEHLDIAESKSNSNYEVSYINDGNNAQLPKELHPVVKQNVQKLQTITRKKGIQMVITEDVRTKKSQDLLYDQGRNTNGSIVTQARGGESYHNYGLAIDFALKDKTDSIIWDMKYDGNQSGKPDWLEVVAIAKDLGFTWGGDWVNFKDNPHLQMNFGLSITDLQNGLRPKS